MISMRIEKLPEKAPTTVKHSQVRAEALEKAKTRGAKFTATGGENVTPNDMFKDMEMVMR